jgi:hypothetical protein
LSAQHVTLKLNVPFAILPIPGRISGFTHKDSTGHRLPLGFLPIARSVTRVALNRTQRKTCALSRKCGLHKHIQVGSVRTSSEELRLIFSAKQTLIIITEQRLNRQIGRERAKGKVVTEEKFTKA